MASISPSLIKIKNQSPPSANPLSTRSPVPTPIHRSSSALVNITQAESPSSSIATISPKPKSLSIISSTTISPPLIQHHKPSSPFLKNLLPGSDVPPSLTTLPSSRRQLTPSLMKSISTTPASLHPTVVPPHAISGARNHMPQLLPVPPLPPLLAPLPPPSPPPPISPTSEPF